MIIQLPSILPGDLDLATVNQQLRSHEIQLDWSGVISAPESQLAILLEGVDEVEDADWLISGDIAENIATDIINFFNNRKSKTKKSRSPKKSPATKGKPQVWEQGKLLETQFVPGEREGQLLEEQFIPTNNVTTEEEKPENNQILASQIPNAYKIRE